MYYHVQPHFYAPWPQCCAHFVFMCAPLISRDGQQQSRGVNSCIRVLIIAVMRSLLARIPLLPPLNRQRRQKRERVCACNAAAAAIAPFTIRYYA